jgi:Secretion system C-terminal sorting domain
LPNHSIPSKPPVQYLLFFLFNIKTLSMKKFTFFVLFAVVASFIHSNSAYGQITFRSSSNGTGTGATITIPKPGSLAIGDVMIANIVQGDDNQSQVLSDASLTGANEWKFVTGGQFGNNGGNSWWGTLLYRVATSADVAAADFTFSLDAETNSSLGGIVAYYNVNATGGVGPNGIGSGPFDVAVGTFQVTGGTSLSLVTAPTISTVTPGAGVIMFAMAGDDNDFNNPWATGSISLTEVLDIESATNPDKAAGAAWAIQDATGPTGAGTVTMSGSDRNGGVLVALKPLPPTVTINPPALSISTILVGQSLNLTANRSANASWPNGNTTWKYTWSSTGPSSPAFTNNNVTIAGTSSATVAGPFSTAGTYTIICTVQEQGAGGLTAVSVSKTINVLAAAPTAANLWATSSDGTQVSSFVVSNGTYFAGPTNIFDPTIGGTLTSSAALGLSDKPTVNNGFFYWLPNTGTNGVVNVYGATFAGATPTLIGTLDVNGASTNSLGFVRLGMGPDGTGWILAGDGTTVYLAKFAANGLTPVTPVLEDANGVTLNGGAASTFQNGDVCVSGNGNIYALANDGGGVTQIFIGAPAGNSTTFTKQWDLVDNTNAAFSGRVNGVAFDVLGSLYLSTDNGLYFIDQNTVNGPAGTVGCFLVQSVTGLQDLASNFFPTRSLLPAKLLSFTASYKNQNTLLKWDVESLQNFSHFEVERSSNGIDFGSVAAKQPVGNPADRATYQHTDNLAAVNGTAFYYRLKLIDLDGRFTYSNVVLVRKEEKSITGIKISPNPVLGNATTTVRFEAAANITVDFKVVDLTGRIVLAQQTAVTEGTNSVNIANLNRLQPGMYILQMNSGNTTETAKFIIAR